MDQQPDIAPVDPTLPTPMPTAGGCWVRQADGSLAPDLNEHPPAAPDAAQEKAS